MRIGDKSVRPGAGFEGFLSVSRVENMQQDFTHCLLVLLRGTKPGPAPRTIPLGPGPTNLLEPMSRHLNSPRNKEPCLAGGGGNATRY